MAITKNTADLLAQAASTLPDNTTQQISPQDEREMAENIAQSSYNKISDSALVGLKEYSTIPTYESGQGCISSNKIYISNKITGPGAFVPADWDLYDELTAADKAKLDFITVTSGADLDQMQTDIAALDGARINKGTFDQALGVFPGGGTAQDGWTWIATGVTTIIDGVEINPDDAIVAITDNASTTVFAANWHLQDNTDKVLSVNSQSGNVVLSKTDIGLSNVPNTDATDRANHTGTQLVATISDFDSEVASNTAVAANTAKVSADGSIDTHSDVDTTTTPPVLNDVLQWDGANFVPAVSGGGSNIYTADGTIGSSRVATLTDSLTFDASGVGGDSIKILTGTNVNKGFITYGAAGAERASLYNISSGAESQLSLKGSGGQSYISSSGTSVINTSTTNIGTFTVSPSSAAYNFNVKQPNGANGLRVYTANGQNEFHLHDNGGGSAVVRFLSSGICYFNTAGSVGVGLTAPTAKLHIKGAGSTSGTTALLVQNSLGTDLLEVKDDGRTTIDGAVTINRTTGNSALTLNGASNSNNQLYFTKSGAAKWYLRPNYAAAGSDEFLILNGSEAQQLRLNQTGEVSLGGFAPVTNERLRIKGFGVGTNIALAVTNNANVVNFQVLDNGSVGIGGAPSGEKLYVKGVIKSADTVNTNGVQLDGTATSNNNLLFSQSGTPTWYVGTDNLGSDEFKWRDAGFTTRMALTQGGDLGVGISAPTAKLHVVGGTLLDGNLGVFGTTPIAQPTTAIIAPAPVAVGGVNVQTNDTFEGYTLSQVVKALRNLGVLA